MNWIEIASLTSIPPLGSRIVATGAGDIALFRTSDDRVFAVRDRCPHKQGPLSQGIVHGCKVTCPLHNWVIDLNSGEAVAPDQGKVTTYETKIEAGTVYLKLNL